MDNTEFPKVLGVIGARGGSKRLPQKNVLPLLGKPLINWSIEAALSSQVISRLVVSTDCKNIARVAKQAGAEVPYLRPHHLATDTASSIDFVMDVLNFYHEQGEQFDYVMLLQPTSPLRSVEDICGIMELAKKNRSTPFFVSVTECEHSPLWSTKIDSNGAITGFLEETAVLKRAQDLEPYYRLNGALYLADVETLIQDKSFYVKEKTLSYCMPKARSVDIDDLFDFRFAEFLLEKEN